MDNIHEYEILTYALKKKLILIIKNINIYCFNIVE